MLNNTDLGDGGDGGFLDDGGLRLAWIRDRRDLRVDWVWNIGGRWDFWFRDNRNLGAGYRSGISLLLFPTTHEYG